jgi:hypothetical protein
LGDRKANAARSRAIAYYEQLEMSEFEERCNAGSKKPISNQSSVKSSRGHSRGHSRGLQKVHDRSSRLLHSRLPSTYDPSMSSATAVAEADATEFAELLRKLQLLWAELRIPERDCTFFYREFCARPSRESRLRVERHIAQV